MRHLWKNRISDVAGFINARRRVSYGGSVVDPAIVCALAAEATSPTTH